MIIIKLTFERWKYNKEYKVWVSSLGRIKSKLFQRKEKHTFVNGTTGYVGVKVYNTKKEDFVIKAVHRLVMETFIGKSDLTVDHVNSNKRDNRLCNLEYVSQKENTRRAEEKLQKELTLDTNSDIQVSEILNSLANIKDLHTHTQFSAVGDVVKDKKHLIAQQRKVNKAFIKLASNLL